MRWRRKLASDGIFDGKTYAPPKTRAGFPQVVADCLVPSATNPKVLPGRRLRRVARLHNFASARRKKGRSGGQVVRRSGAARRARRGGWANQPIRSQTARHGAPGRERVADSGMGRDESFANGRRGGDRRRARSGGQSGRSDRARGLHRHPQLNAVVRRVYQVLFCPKIPFRRLNGRVPEKQLDLLQFPARNPAQRRAGATTMPHAA
jgi:hypothetical protein